MAGESTYALISHLIPEIWEAVLYYMGENYIMPALVRQFTDQTGDQDRQTDEWIDDTDAVLDSLGETEDMSADLLLRELLSQLSPKEVGKQYLITDRRMESERVANVMADAVRFLGAALGKKMERDIMANFANLRGGSYGSASNRFFLDMLYWGRAKLEAANVPGPYQVVMHPNQWRDVQKELTALNQPAPLALRQQVENTYYVQNIADFSIYVSRLLPRTLTTGEIHSIHLNGATGGTFTLVFRGEETAAIAYDALAADIELAFEALSSVPAGEGSVAIDAGDGDFTITYSGTLIDNTEVPTIRFSSLTGYSAFPYVILKTEAVGYYKAAMFNPQSMAIDLRRGLRVEPDRDASLRSTELNATMKYATGLWRPEWGLWLGSEAAIAAPSQPA